LIRDFERGLEILRGFFGAAHLGVQIPEQQLENRISRVALDERLRDHDGAFVLIVKGAQISGEMEAHFHGRNYAVVNTDLHLANSFRPVAARNPHEEAQDFHGGGKRIHVVVVEAEAGGGVWHLRIEFQSAQKFGAGGNSGTRDRAIFTAQDFQAHLQSKAHASVEMHIRRIRFGDLCVGEINYSVG